MPPRTPRMEKTAAETIKPIKNPGVEPFPPTGRHIVGIGGQPVEDIPEKGDIDGRQGDADQGMGARGKESCERADQSAVAARQWSWRVLGPEGGRQHGSADDPQTAQAVEERHAGQCSGDRSSDQGRDKEGRALLVHPGLLTVSSPHSIVFPGGDQQGGGSIVNRVVDQVCLRSPYRFFTGAGRLSPPRPLIRVGRTRRTWGGGPG